MIPLPLDHSVTFRYHVRYQQKGSEMYVMLIATEDRINPFDLVIPTGAYVTMIDLTDKPAKGAFIDRFTVQGSAFYRSLNKSDIEG